MALLLSIQTLGTVPEFGQTALLYGMFLMPLMAIWVVPRLFPSHSEMGWQITSKIPRWRLILEHGLLGLVLFGLLWALLLCFAWVVHAIFVTQVGTADSTATPAFTGWLWLQGLLSLVFFTGLAVLGSQLWNVQTAGFLATGLWIGSLLLARVDEGFGYLLPFGAYYRLAKSEINLQAPELEIHTGLLFLASLAVWAVGIGSSSAYRTRSPRRKNQSHRPVRNLFTRPLAWGLRGPFWLRLVWQELQWASRRRFLWVYWIAPIGVIIVISGFYRNLGITDFVPLMMSNLLFFTPPLFAVFLVPALTRNVSSGRDWFWSTPLVWTQTALAQLLSCCVLAAVTALIWGTALFTWGLVQEAWSWQQALTLAGPLGRLWLPMALAQACLICGLTLLLRQAMVAIALTCVITVGLWLTTDILTLVSPQDISLVSLRFNAVAGAGPEQILAESWVFACLAVGMGIWLIALAGFPVQERRATWTRPAQFVTWCLVLAGLGMCGLASWNYTHRARAATVPATTVSETPVWNVMKASHNAQIGDGVLAVESSLTLVVPPGVTEPGLSLQLNPGLDLETVEWERRAVYWERTGEVVQIVLPEPEAQIASERPVELVLRYSGWPVLLREDYALAMVFEILSDRIVSHYPRANVSYARAPFLQWFRDSDWTVWPLASGPHVAMQANSWTIALSHGTYPVIAAPGSTSRAVSDRTFYTWQETPPSVLLLAGSLDPPAPGEPPVWLGPWQRASDRERIQLVMEMYQRLADWSGEGASPMHAAYFPYGQRFHFADAWVLVPATADVHEIQSDRERLDLAVRVAEDWLQEQLRWRRPAYSTQGLHAQYALNCEIPEDRHQLCFLADDQYRVNPQAPQGRNIDTDYCLYPSNAKCGRLSLLKRAWAIVLGYYIVAEPAWLQDEWAEWYRTAQTPERSSTPHDLAGTLRRFHNVCLLSSYVLTIHELVEQHGQDFLRDWFAVMRELHPPGSATPVDEEVWNLAATITGEPQSDLYPTVCMEVVLAS